MRAFSFQRRKIRHVKRFSRKNTLFFCVTHKTSSFLRAAERRCVLVVTGKGLKDDWSVGALRQALPGWLNAPDLRRLILAYCHAQPQHGGSGAVYILLRRERGGGKGGGREGN